MIRRAFVAATFCLALLAGLPAEAKIGAKTVRFPEAGDPAFQIEVPDDWLVKEDGRGNLLIGTADRSAGFSLSLAKVEGDLDVLAGEIMKVAQADLLPGKIPASVSGLQGFTYAGSKKNDAGVELKMTLTLLRAGKGYTASLSKLVAASSRPQQQETAEAFLKSIEIIPPK
jgi:hypothetical protein